MLKALARTTLLVRDYEEALRFYRDLLGFEVLFDAKLDDRGRFLHLGVPGQLEAGLWLHEARTPEERAVVGRQAGTHPFLVLYTSDCRALSEKLLAEGVRFRKEPQEDTGAIVAHLEDPCGNELVLAQLTSNA